MSKSVPQLTAQLSPATGDLLHIVRGGIDYKITYEDFISLIYGPTGNTVYVNSVYGDDATAQVENPAKPFLTIAAAHAASAAYWTGGTAPSAANIITFKIKGTFTENVTLKNYHNYDISDSDITGLIGDGGVSTNSIIYGNGSIAATSSNVLQATAASTIVVKIYSITGRIVPAHASAFINISGVQYMYVNNDNVFNLVDGTLWVDNCYITGFGQPVLLTGNEGTAIFRDCVFLSDNEILKTPTSANTSVIKFDNCYMKTTGSNKDTVNLLTNTGGNVALTLKNCTLIANGTGNSIDAAQATNVYIQGSCETNLTHDTGNVTLLGGTVANGRFLISTDIS